MRDILLVALFVLPLPFALTRPWVGILIWATVSVMNPHRLTYGFASTFSFAQIAAAVTLLAIVITKDERKLKGGGLALLYVVMIVWMNFTTINPLNPPAAWAMWDRVMKVHLMTLVTLLVFSEKRHVQALIWVLAVSLGFYGIKGGLFVLRTGAAGRVVGPEGSPIEDNNHFGLAMVMAIPLMVHLYQTASSRWIRLGLACVALLTAVAALGTFSRGALLAISSMAFVLWLRSEQKIRFGLLLFIVAGVLVPLMPDSWDARMRSIGEYNSDGSVLGRFNSWQTATNVAIDRIAGGGFEFYSPSTSLLYSPIPTEVRAMHSIYFQMLGEHGFIGLGMFLLLWVWTWGVAGRIRRLAKGVEDLVWARSLASMIQVSLVGYLVGGTFLNLAHWDVPYFLFASVIVTRSIVEKRLLSGTVPGGRSTRVSQSASSNLIGGGVR